MDKAKKALICGASSGIGLETAKVFLSNGYTVYSTSRRKPPIDSDKLIHYTSDFYDNDSIASSCRQILEDSGGEISIVINCVGDILHEKTIKDFTGTQLLNTFQINFFSSFVLSQHLFDIIANNKGCFAFVSSVAKDKVYPLISDYCAAKASLSNFIKSLAIELAPHGARAVAVSPAVVATPLFEKSNFTKEQAESFHKLNRIGNPEEIADLLYYLTSSKGKWITGTDYVIDGGMLL